MKRTRLKRKSKKQSKIDSKYQQLKKEYFEKEENQYCAICGTNSGLSIHHKSKRGNNTNITSTWVTLCLMNDFTKHKYPDMNHSHSGGCHGFVEANKEWARNNGYLS